jgi:hypothetical protein
MKKLFLFLLMVAFVIASSAAYAAQQVPFKAPLRIGNLAVKLDYINFTDDVAKDFDNDKGLYVGLEGYTAIAPNLYLGAEVGYANPDGSIDIAGTHVDTEVTFVPIELNLKYAIQSAPNLVIDFGAGVSSNYVKEEESAFGFSDSRDDWLFGGQFFIDLNYTMNQFFMGVNAKYQLTEDFKDFNYNYNNWRIGGQIGVMF